MQNQQFEIGETEVRISKLLDSQGNWMQTLYSLVPQQTHPIQRQIELLEAAEKSMFEGLSLGADSCVARRFFVSDSASHYSAVQAFRSRQDSEFFLSLTEQPPCSGAKACLLGMCLANISERFRRGKIFYFDTTSQLRHIFAEQLVANDASDLTDVEYQTHSILENLQAELATFGASIQNNVLRTWLYAPHVDADYPGIVKARKLFFDSVQLTKDTHYIASTGIQGASENRFARVSLDAYAAIGVGMEKIRYIQAPAHMSTTDLYGVTFERATAVLLGQTDFLSISGTASIDTKGDIVHPGDVVAQTGRTLENIQGLLDSSGFARSDLSSFIVYLRDATDYGFIRPVVEEFAGGIPCVYVKAAVCRPGWLIEIEATAARNV